MEQLKRKNGNVYRVKIYVEGKPITKTFKRKTDAQAWKTQHMSMRNAEGLNLKHFEKVGFEFFAKKWLEEKVLAYRSNSTYEGYAMYIRRHFIPHFGDLCLNEIQRHHIDKFVVALKKKEHNTRGINLIMGCLRTLFNAAVEEDYLRASPLKGFKNLKEDLRSEIYMTKTEIMQFLRANSQDSNYPLYVVAMNSGMRRGELCGLKWDRVNFQQMQLEVAGIRDRRGYRATTKTGRRRVVPMNDQVKSLLLAMYGQKKSEFVFEEDDGTPINPHHVYRAFTKAQEKATLERHFRFHDLRHTFASHFMMNGGNIYDLQKILGHTQIEMTMRYAHLSPDHLAEAINVVSLGIETTGEVVDLWQARKKSRESVVCC
ncbi:MAG: hypothetical protein A2X86_08155 [Bdellovibrionales bacterium GWA2_49_15]|nr:MAG: hypothetical protein A2X86_08155 [Bdellovibrionales bacterium GWA2_49_15]